MLYNILPKDPFPFRVYIKPFHALGTGWLNFDPGSILKSKYMVGVFVLTGDYKINNTGSKNY